MAFDVGSAVGYLLLDASGWNKGLTSAKQALNTFMDDSATLADKANALGNSFQGIGMGLTTTVTAPLVGLGTVAVKTAATFEQGMAQVQATLGITSDAMSELDGQSVNTMDALSKLAKEMGASTKFSATEAAAAINNMAMAGYEVQEIYDTLPDVLNLASAGALDLDYATQLVANGLNVMGLSSEDAAEMADKLAVTASSAYGSVSDFGEGLLVAGAQAKLANVSLTNTFTALGILGDNGIAASEGGTYLRNTLKNLYTPTEDAAKALAELEVETRNSDDSVRDFQEVLQDLGGALDGMSEGDRLTYMSRIFDTRTISAANALIENSGERFDELSEKIENAGGAAQKMADTQLDTLEGKITIFKSAMEGLAISFGELLLPMLTSLVEKITSVVDWLNSLDEGTKKMILSVAGFAAALGPVLVTTGTLIKSITSISSGISGLVGFFSKLGPVLTGAGTAASGAGASFAALAAPIAAIVAVIGTLVAAFKHLWDTNEEFRSKIVEIWESITGSFSSFFEGITERINALGFSFESFGEILSAVWNGFTELLGPVFIGIFNNIAIVVQTTLDLILNILDVFIGLFTGNWEQFWGGIVGIFTTLWEGMIAYLENILTTIGDVVNVILGWFGTSWQELWQGAVDAVIGFVDGIVQGIVSVIDWFAALPENVSTAVTSTIQSISAFAAEVANNLVNGVSQAIDNVVQWFLSLPERIAYALGYALGYITEWGANTIAYLSEAIPQAIDSVVQWFSELPGRIWEWLLQALDSVVQWGQSVIEAFTQWWDSFISTLSEWFLSIPGAVTQWLAGVIDAVVTWGVNLIEAASEALESFVGAIVEWLAGIPAAFEEWFTQALDWLLSLPETLYEIGANMLNSLWEGMKSIVTGIFDWIGGVVDSIVGAFTGGVKDGVAAAQSDASKVAGSYATGLDYAPRDMRVQIHEGEGILTKEENAQYRGQNGNGDGFPETLSFNLSIPLDGQVVAQKTYTYNVREGTLRGEDLVEQGVVQ